MKNTLTKKEIFEVLVVEDSPSDSGLVEEALLEADDSLGFNVRIAGDLKEASLAIETMAPDVILLDLNLPDSRGLKTFEYLHARFPDIATVILSGESDLRTALKAVELGAQDYVAKGEIESRSLIRSIHYSYYRSIAIKQIRAAETAALQASRLKSEFLACMSHELRTPLNGVIGMSEMLLRTPLSPIQQRYAEIAHSSGETLLRIINDVLNFSKIEAGKVELEQHIFDLRSALEASMDAFLPEVQTKPLIIASIFAPDLPEKFMGDEGKIRQIVNNLLSNSLKFTASGWIKLEVRQEGGFGAFPMLYISVKDSGIGIEKDKITKIFEPFVQSDASIQRRYGGTGLGLSISNKLAELMGGSLQLESEVNAGSTFTLCLPVRRSFPQNSEGRSASCDMRNGVVIICDDPTLEEVILTQIPRNLRKLRLKNFDQLQGSRETIGEWNRLICYFRDRMGLADLQKSIRPTLDANPQAHILYLATDEKELQQITSQDLGSRVLSMPVNILKQTAIESFILRGAETELRPQLMARDKNPTSQSRRQQGKVLIVDDNMINQYVMQAMVEAMGYRTRLACSGSAAISAHKEEEFLLILLDCQMPDLDGYETVRILRQQEQNRRRTPVVAVTAHALEGEREKCLAAGMDDYLSKPVRKVELEAIFAKFCTSAGELVESLEFPLDVKIVGELQELGKVLKRNLLNEVSMIFAERSDRILCLMDDAAQNSRWAEIADLAHGLKGSAAQIGAAKLLRLCSYLEAQPQALREQSLKDSLHEAAREAHFALNRVAEGI